MRPRVHAAAVLAIGFAATILGVGPASATPYPVTTDVVAAQRDGLTGPADRAPAGANRPDCHDRYDRDPVILVHGTASNQASAWSFLAPTLANAGFCVYTFTFGQVPGSGSVGGLGPRATSTHQLADFIDHVRKTTGATTVDLVGHSQGAAVAQSVTQLPDRAEQVGTMVNVSGANRGYSFGGTPPPPGEGDNGPNHPNIRYANLATTHDEVVFPLRNALMEPAQNVTNVVVQDVCPASEVGHLGMIYSPTVAALIQNALDPTSTVAVPCGRDFPF
ncbi:esterase/lipase family protein [Gordonia aichiensis]|uniref:Putative triacylglycerol lipase n=1 Tax=Gordonia aichiensis NBRC 108223 TaxID=1220583 RepID=L7KFT9_9ACTN|nr:alpha/beta fold hydrolase [Gordonia aichiensis]GAC47755.1 putative triacylglycerol lipase [Gordonia aichiensis NBRC 108223]